MWASQYAIVDFENVAVMMGTGNWLFGYGNAEATDD